MALVLECRYLTPRRFQGKFEVVVVESTYGRSIACARSIARRFSRGTRSERNSRTVQTFLRLLYYSGGCEQRGWQGRLRSTTTTYFRFRKFLRSAAWWYRLVGWLVGHVKVFVSVPRGF